jgi:hypothetical protein
MTIKSLYPNVRPTLNLDFAKTKALDPRITFTRASTATFVGADGLIKTAASGAARFDHNPATGESLGLLVEEARTNELSQSQTFSTWTLGNASITTNATTSPDGTNNASKLIEDGTTNIHRIYLSINPSGNYTMSVFAKAAERSILTLMPATTGGGDTPVYFDLSNGTISGSLGSANSASIQSYPNGWYRCSVTDGMGGFGYPFIGVAAVSGTHSYAGNGTSGIYVWGAQLEAGTFPTSYIPTTTATVTRAADVASMTGTNFSSWYNQSAGSIFTNVQLLPGSIRGDLDAGVYFMRGSNTTGAIRHDYQGNFVSFLTTNSVVLDNSGTAYSSPAFAVAPTTRKAATSFNTGNITYSLNNTSGSASGVVMPTGVDRVLLCGFNNSNGLNKTIARLAYYPVRLPDAQLQALTAT